MIAAEPPPSDNTTPAKENKREGIDNCKFRVHNVGVAVDFATEGFLALLGVGVEEDNDAAAAAVEDFKTYSK